MLFLKTLYAGKYRTGKDNWLLALLLGLGAIALGYALQINNGALHPKSIAYLTLALVFTLFSVISPPIPRLFSNREKLVLFVLGLGLAFQLGQLLTSPPGIYLELSELSAFAPFFLGIIVAIVLTGTIFWPIAWLDSIRIPLLVLTYLMMGVWLIKASPNPFIDVYVFQKDGVLALLSGNNPYSMNFPNIYGHSQFYGPGLSDNYRLNFGFPYPPLSLLLALPGQLFAGDYRYSQLVATGLSALFMAYTRPSKLGTLAAALFLFTPRTFFVLEQGWTEPYIVMLLAATVFFARHRPQWLALPLGLLLVIKQYMIFTLPLVFLLLPQRSYSWKDIGKLIAATALVGLLVSLPLALWNLSDFWESAITLQLWQPFRTDALSYLAWFSLDGAGRLPAVIAFAAAFLAAGIALWRASRSPAGFATGVAFVYLVFFAFNKQAFCNYYYLVIGAMCCAIAASRYGPDRNEDSD